MKQILTQKEITFIEKFCNEYDIQEYTINTDGTIDVTGDVYIEDLGMKKIPIEFNIVHGDFYISHSFKTTTLKGLPRIIKGSLGINFLGIKTLEYFPIEVSGDIILNGNDHLKHIHGLPKKVNGEFMLCESAVESLDGMPDEIKKTCDLSQNTDLVSLEGMTQLIGGDVNLESLDNLTSLKGIPSKIHGNFQLESCEKITNLEYMPRSVSGNLIMRNMDTKTLKNLTPSIGGNLIFSDVFVDELGLTETIEIGGDLNSENFRDRKSQILDAFALGLTRVEMKEFIKYYSLYEVTNDSDALNLLIDEIKDGLK